MFCISQIQGKSLYSAAKSGNLGEVQALLAQGVDVNWADEVRSQRVIELLHSEGGANKYGRNFKQMSMCVCVRKNGGYY